MSRFDEKISRYHTGSVKYDFPERFGKPEGLLPLWVADMDFKTADVIIEALKKQVEFGIYGYSDAMEGYYESLKNWFSKRHKYEIMQEEIIKTPGVIFALSAAIKAFTKEGDAVIIQQPVYHPFEACVKKTNRVLINSELSYENGTYGMNLEDFENKIKEFNVKLFILCSPHNPVGRVWTKEELKAVGDICLQNNVFVIADEIHCDFVWDGYKHTVFASISEAYAQNAMVCTAPSKTFNMAGIQVSNIFVRNPEKRKLLKQQIELTGYDELNIFALATCEAAYRDGAQWLEELKQYLKGNFEFIKQYLKKNIPEIKLVESEGTYLAWMDFSQLSLGEDELDRLLGEAGLWLNAGSGFGTKSGQFQRLNMACPRSVIEQAMEQLSTAVSKRSKSK